MLTILLVIKNYIRKKSLCIMELLSTFVGLLAFNN